MSKTSPVQPPLAIDDFGEWLAAFARPTVLIELASLAVCVALAWGFVALLRRAVREVPKHSIWFGHRLVDGVLFPAVLLCLAYVARALLQEQLPLVVFKVAMAVLVSLVVIRVGVKVLRAAFYASAWARVLERTISWVAWLCMVLWVSGLLPVVLIELEQITWKVGGTTLSVRSMIEGTLTAGAVLILTLWVSAGIESRLLQSATGASIAINATGITITNGVATIALLGPSVMINGTALVVT